MSDTCTIEEAKNMLAKCTDFDSFAKILDGLTDRFGFGLVTLSISPIAYLAIDPYDIAVVRISDDTGEAYMYNVEYDGCSLRYTKTHYNKETDTEEKTDYKTIDELVRDIHGEITRETLSSIRTLDDFNRAYDAYSPLQSYDLEHNGNRYLVHFNRGHIYISKCGKLFHRDGIVGMSIYRSRGEHKGGISFGLIWFAKGRDGHRHVRQSAIPTFEEAFRYIEER